jgi:hypothetical protein
MQLRILVLSSLALAGCSFAARSPEMYRDEARSALESKSNDIRVCYDGVLKSSPGAQGRVTVKFEVETEGGKFVNVAVDKANTTAPAPVADCVTKNIAGLTIKPPDARTGEATWTYEFTAPPPAASAPKT